MDASGGGAVGPMTTSAEEPRQHVLRRRPAWHSVRRRRQHVHTPPDREETTGGPVLFGSK